jgi:hypothetical protein
MRLSTKRENEALNPCDCETLWLAGRSLVLLRISISFVVEFLEVLERQRRNSSLSIIDPRATEGFKL